jgi:anaphase-promoting complex subunit 6
VGRGGSARDKGKGRAKGRMEGGRREGREQSLMDITDDEEVR